MSRAAPLWAALALNAALVAGLVVVRVSAHSIGVLAERADYLADAAAIGVSLVALWPLGPAGDASHGPTATAFAALVNGGWLLVLVVSAVVAHHSVRLLGQVAAALRGIAT
jgi:cobalt-zinc-cadmium efflux system protein